MTPISKFSLSASSPLQRAPVTSSFAPPSHVCTPAFSASPPPTILTSPRMRAHLPPRTLCHILSRALSSPLPSVVPTAGLDCRYPEDAFTLLPQPPLSILSDPSNHISSSQFHSCLSPRDLYPAGCQTFLCIRVVVCGGKLVKNAVSKDSNSAGLGDA